MRKDEYIQLYNSIKSSRYYNIKRTGTIICRACRAKSPTPNLHIQHVHTHHSHLLNFCPYCQKEIASRNGRRVTKKYAIHLKFCCYIHKVENTKFRILFNNNFHNDKNQESYSGKIIVKTSILTLPHILYSSQFLLNVLQYEKQTKINTYINQSDSDSSCLSDSSSIMSSPVYSSEIQFIQTFHSKYTLSESRTPSWFHISSTEINNNSFNVLVACNKLTFDSTENIDCMLIRVMNMHWNKFRAFLYTIKLNDFTNSIENFKQFIRDESFVITRYMHMFNSNNDELILSMIVIIPVEKGNRVIDLISVISMQISEIENLDMLIDTCLDLSCNNVNAMKFPNNEILQIMNINYNRDVLSSANSHRETLQLSTSHIYDTFKSGFNKFFSPLSYNAKVYFYSQTTYGCVRAFDRLLHSNNIANHITDVVSENGVLYIYYSSLSSLVDDICEINFLSDEEFAKEKYYRNNSVNIYDNREMKIFILDPDNIKLVIKKNLNNSSDLEETIFPNCLFSTNIKYKLTTFQTTIFKVAQYHREKLLLEQNNIPSLSTF